MGGKTKNTRKAILHETSAACRDRLDGGEREVGQERENRRKAGFAKCNGGSNVKRGGVSD